MRRSDLKNRAAVNSTPSTKPLQSALDLASPSASHEGSCFKENINVNKFETPKLSMEPLQMKKKKKGYNLRKSLAWDRAFFTEEGVLDPLELSIISGVDELPVINEDTLGRSQLTTKTPVRKELKNNLSKEFPKEDLDKNRRKHCLSPKLNSSSSNIMISTSLTPHNVSTHVGGSSRSRCGDCPRPLPSSSSSLKRLASANAGKAVAKGIKLPKAPASKTGPTSVLTSGSSIPKVNPANRNYTAQPVLSTQRNAGLRSLSKVPKNTQSASKASTIKPAQLSDRHSSNTSNKRHSSVNIGLLLGGEADKCSGSNTIMNNTAPSMLLRTSQGQDEIKTSAAPLAQSALDSGRSIHPPQIQTMKHSGLRMPSPSLSFFTQTKASPLHDLPVRDTHTETFGSQKPGNFRLQDTSRIIFKKDTNIQESPSRGSVAICSRSGNVVPSQVNGVSHEITKSNLERKPTQVVDMKFVNDPLNSEPTAHTLVRDLSYVDEQTRDAFEKIGTERISPDDAEIQRIDNEMSSHRGSYEQMIIDKKLEKEIQCRQLEPASVSEHNNAIHGSETKSSIAEPCKGQSTCKFAVFDQSAITNTQYENLKERGQESMPAMQEQSKPDFHESCREKINKSEYSPCGTTKNTDKDENLLMTKEREGELLGGSEVYGSWCSDTGKLQAPEHSETSTRHSYTGSKHQDGYLYEESASTEVMTGKLLVGEECMKDAVCGSTIGGCQNHIIISSSGDYAEQTGSILDVRNVCDVVELESQRIGRPNTSDILLPEKQICLEKPDQEKLVEISPLVLNQKGGKKSSDSKMGSPRAEVGMHGCNSDDIKKTGLIISSELNSISSKSLDNLSNMMSNPDGRDACKAEFDASPNETLIPVVTLSGRYQDESESRNQEAETALFNSPANRRLANSHYHETGEMEMDHCSSLPKRRMPKRPWKSLDGNVTGEVLITEVCGGIKCTTSNITLKEGGTNMDDQSSAADWRTMLVQSATMDECRGGESECLELSNTGTVVEDQNHSSGGLQFENFLRIRSTLSNEPSEDDMLGSTVDSFTGQEVSVGTLRNSSDSVQDSSLEQESCSHKDESDDQSYFQEAILDASRNKPFPYLTKSQVSEDNSSSFNEIYPKLDQVQDKAALLPRNQNGDSLNKKSRELVLPQNATPFSDEWLAAIEAAGEDILTRKSGTVQNSPPDKTHPEPSPWSPVKRKNNQIGPFDCTKFTNN